MGIAGFLVLIFVVMGLLSEHAGEKRRQMHKLRENEQEEVYEGRESLFHTLMVISILLAFASLVSMVVIGSNLPYTAYNLEKGDRTDKLIDLPSNLREEDGGLFVRSRLSLEGDLSYVYAVEALDGSREIAVIDARYCYVDKRDGEEPHMEIYFLKGLKDWYTYLYAYQPSDKKYIYVLVVPESEDIAETFFPR